jgi:hypothetical protein
VCKQVTGMSSDNWYKCVMCGYEWKEQDVDISRFSWYEEEVVVKCHECRDAVDKPKKENINEGFEPC